MVIAEPLAEITTVGAQLTATVAVVEYVQAPVVPLYVTVGVVPHKPAGLKTLPVIPGPVNAPPNGEPVKTIGPVVEQIALAKPEIVAVRSCVTVTDTVLE